MGKASPDARRQKGGPQRPDAKAARLAPDIPHAVALRTLVAQISAGDYRDGLGQRLTLNTAYLEALALLDLDDVLERPRSGSG